MFAEATRLLAPLAVAALLAGAPAIADDSPRPPATTTGVILAQATTGQDQNAQDAQAAEKPAKPKNDQATDKPKKQKQAKKKKKKPDQDPNNG